MLLTLRIASTNSFPTKTSTLWLPPATTTPVLHGIKIEMFSESDMFFYFSNVVSDTDYQQIKLEQKLLVDFAHFPAMIRELLANKCMVPALQIEPSGDAMLSIVESNQFRELTHIALKTKRGNDDSVKTYLADRLCQFRHRMESLEDQNSSLREDLRRFQIERDSVLRDMDSSVHSMRSQYQSEIALLKEDHSRELRKMHSSVSNECDSECRKFSDSLRLMEEKLRETERKFDETRLCLVSSQSEHASAQRRIMALENEVDTSREILNKSINESREYLNKNFDLEKRMAEIGIEAISLREKLKRASDREDEEVRINKLKNELKERDDENEKLRMKLKELKTVTTKSNEALLKQEQVVIALQSKLEEVNSQQLESEQMRQKLLEANKLLESNAQVIAYLNKKLNDRDYSFFGAIPVATPSPISSTPPSIPPDFPTRSNVALLSTTTATAEPVVKKPSASIFSSSAVKFTPRCNSQSAPLIKP